MLKTFSQQSLLIILLMPTMTPLSAWSEKNYFCWSSCTEGFGTTVHEKMKANPLKQFLGTPQSAKSFHCLTRCAIEENTPFLCQLLINELPEDNLMWVSRALNCEEESDENTQSHLDALLESDVFYKACLGRLEEKSRAAITAESRKFLQETAPSSLKENLKKLRSVSRSSLKACPRF